MMVFKPEPQKPQPTTYAVENKYLYASGDICAFHVEPESGDIFLHFYEGGQYNMVHIFFGEWESMVTIVNEEHDAIMARVIQGD